LANFIDTTVQHVYKAKVGFIPSVTVDFCISVYVCLSVLFCLSTLLCVCVCHMGLVPEINFD